MRARNAKAGPHSTVTLFARFLGWSISQPRSRATSRATAGVGTTPSRTAVAPEASSPAINPCSSIPPDSRVSLPINTLFPLRHFTIARPSRSATCAVIGYSWAIPLIPSVPKSFAMTVNESFLFSVPEQGGSAQLNFAETRHFFSRQFRVQNLEALTSPTHELGFLSTKPR